MLAASKLIGVLTEQETEQLKILIKEKWPHVADNYPIYGAAEDLGYDHCLHSLNGNGLWVSAIYRDQDLN